MKRKKKRGQKRKPQHCNPQAVKNIPVKKKKSFPVKPVLTGAGIIAAIAAVVLISVFCIAPALKKDVLDMSKYIQVSVEGKNGEGEASYTCNDAYLIEAIGGAGVDPDIFFTDEVLERMDYLSQFKISMAPAEGLSNNDVVTVTVTYPGNALSKAKVKAENLEFTYVVSGLEE